MQTVFKFLSHITVFMTKKRQQTNWMSSFIIRSLTKEIKSCSKSSEGGISSKKFRIPSLQNQQINTITVRYANKIAKSRINNR